jgi:hypothetical protein
MNKRPPDAQPAAKRRCSLRTMTMRARVHDLKTEAAAPLYRGGADTCRIDPNSEFLRGV